MKRAPRTWAELIAHRIGYRRMLRVVSMVMCWQITESEVGHRITVEEYADWWGTSHSTAYRDLAHFREALPMFDYPADFIEELGTATLSTRAPKRFREALA